MTSIFWFRQDLRLADNAAWSAACARGPVVPVYILDETNSPRLGAASRWWLHHSLAALAQSLGGLVLRRGDAHAELDALLKEVRADAVFWSRVYEPGAIARDASIKAALKARGVDVQSFNTALMHEPATLKTGAGEPYKVFTPFWRAVQRTPLAAPSPAPKHELAAPPKSDALEDWRLLPRQPNWAAAWPTFWSPGERGAQHRLDDFVEGALRGYSAKRDRPDLAHTSRLSPHLHFGEISPRQISAVAHRALAVGDASQADVDTLLKELGWRDFSAHLLFHFPALPERNWRPSFDAYPWRNNSAECEAWKRGRTGYPYIDAGMRELWATGWMHNRVRMGVASFLVKHLRIDWREGAAWFWDTLVDADLANNSASWQWVAGSGADAAPYFRVFNPIEQGRKFDPDGAYVRQWIPELARLPPRYIHSPFEAPADVLEAAGVRLGETYPAPIVDHASARTAALAGYEATKRASD
ncbi:MAG TPA: deoxyribodipyrimidine photo-lyase [Caulobacterales bacterium]|nr:deoxyribodipyrimidine photo-lyase [Caulobacterales bacterium]